MYYKEQRNVYYKVPLKSILFIPSIKLKKTRVTNAPLVCIKWVSYQIKRDMNFNPILLTSENSSFFAKAHLEISSSY